jgi:hypothetical protein
MTTHTPIQLVLLIRHCTIKSMWPRCPPIRLVQPVMCQVIKWSQQNLTLGCEMLRIPHCLDNRLIDGGKFVILTEMSTRNIKIIMFLGSNNCSILGNNINDMPRKVATWCRAFLFAYLYYGGEKFLRNVRRLSTDYTSLCSRRWNFLYLASSMKKLPWFHFQPFVRKASAICVQIH